MILPNPTPAKYKSPDGRYIFATNIGEGFITCINLYPLDFRVLAAFRYAAMQFTRVIDSRSFVISITLPQHIGDVVVLGQETDTNLYLLIHVTALLLA